MARCSRSGGFRVLPRPIAVAVILAPSLEFAGLAADHPFPTSLPGSGSVSTKREGCGRSRDAEVVPTTGRSGARDPRATVSGEPLGGGEIVLCDTFAVSEAKYAGRISDLHFGGGSCHLDLHPDQGRLRYI